VTGFSEYILSSLGDDDSVGEHVLQGGYMHSSTVLIIDVTKFGLPIDIDDKVLLKDAYDATVKIVYPGVMWDVKDEVMIDGRMAEHRQNLKDNIHFICYFQNSNEKVTIGARNLTSEEFTKVLRTFHFPE
jgi:hypothetical protein